MQKIYSWTLIRKATIILESRVTYASALSFLIAFVFRLVPEILAGPWPLGFDTTTYYIPTILNWASGNFQPVPSENHAPLLYVLLFSAYQISGNIVLVLKIFGPLLYGLLSFSFFFFTHKGLEWQIKKSLLATFLFSTYFVSLRIGWDLYRNMLGLIFFFLFLLLFHKFNELSKSQKIIASTLTILVVLSHEIVAVIMFLIIFLSIILDIRKHVSSKKIKKYLWFIPSFLIFFLMIYISIITFDRIPGSINYLTEVDRSITYPSYYFLVFDIPVLFLLSFGLLLPFVAIGFWRIRILDLWSSICLIGSFWPLFFPWFQIIPWTRWMLMLEPPLIIYAANGFEKLKMPKKKTISSKSFRMCVSKSTVGLIIIVIVSVSYIILPLSSFGTLNIAILERFSYLPAGMLSNTVPLRDFDGFAKCFQNVNERLDADSVLIIHESMMGWTKLYLDPGKTIINYHFKSYLDGLQEALSTGYEKVYLIWWTDSYGWYNQKNAPEEFERVFVSSHVAIYRYIKA